MIEIEETVFNVTFEDLKPHTGGRELLDHRRPAEARSCVLTGSGRRGPL